MVPGSCTRASLVISGPNTPRETTTLATLVFVPCCTPTQSLTAVTSRRWLAQFSISQGSLNQRLYQVLQLFPMDQLCSRRACLRVSLRCYHCTNNHQLGAYTNEKRQVQRQTNNSPLTPTTCVYSLIVCVPLSLYVWVRVHTCTYMCVHFVTARYYAI